MPSPGHMRSFRDAPEPFIDEAPSTSCSEAESPLVREQVVSTRGVWKVAAAAAVATALIATALIAVVQMSWRPSTSFQEATSLEDTGYFAHGSIGCSNWEAIEHQRMQKANKAECAAACTADADCTTFNWMAEACEEGWPIPRTCLLFKGHCTTTRNKCWDLNYPSVGFTVAQKIVLVATGTDQCPDLIAGLKATLAAKGFEGADVTCVPAARRLEADDGVRRLADDGVRLELTWTYTSADRAKFVLVNQFAISLGTPDACAELKEALEKIVPGLTITTLSAEPPEEAKAAEAEVSSVESASYGEDSCPCIGIDGLEGRVDVTYQSVTFAYPADVGAHCEAWDESSDPGCDGAAAPSYCKQPWCYVDPCNCQGLEVPPKPSSYFADAKFQGKPVHYSSVTCGGTDDWSSDDAKKKAQEADNEELCKQTADTAVFGNAKCQCIGIDGLEGIAKITSGDAVLDFPVDMGSTCVAWDSDVDPTCKGDSPPAWCAKAWCYVDPCDCDLPVPSKASSYLPGAKHNGRPVHFSYATCGAEDQGSTEDAKKQAELNKAECA